MRIQTLFIGILSSFLLPLSIIAQDYEIIEGPALEENHAVGSMAEEETPIDSTLEVSLLTCSPGHATYELYGHTALRVRSEAQGYDVVFNYGVFDFYEPMFVWRFVLGECDYMVCPYSYDAFMYEYIQRGSSVTEQVLNLRPREAQEMATALWTNCAKENRVYRYNIFRSNCTTKSRDMIEAHIYGHVIYPVRPRRNTFRTILHQFTRGHVWDEEGNDLLLGASVDTLITERDEMFSPIYLMWYMDSAFVDRGLHRFDPLVRERRILLEENPERLRANLAAQPTFPVTPGVVGWSLFVIGALLAAWELRRQRALWQVDAVLMTLQGIAGLLLTFMALFSQHPGVGSNWQIWVLNPLPLLFVVPVVRAAKRREPFIYHTFAAGLISLFVVLYAFIPQDFSALILPLALLLLSRPIVHLILTKRKTK